MFKITLKQTISGSIWKFLVGSFGAVITILLIGKNFLDMTVQKSVIFGIAMLLVLFVLRYLYFLIRNIIIYIHNVYVDSIWGKAIIDLKTAYSQIHFIRNKEEFTEREFVESMIVFCNTLKVIFDRKTKSNCCVSIKVATTEDERLETLEVKNLCRDTEHSNRDTAKYAETRHTIIGNTPYRVIVNKLLKGNQKHLAYINNQINNTPDYDNTSRDCYNNGVLPYQSELVYPIVPIKGDNVLKLKGFICIDCNQENKFEEDRYDIPMVQGVADGIYDLFVNRNR